MIYLHWIGNLVLHIITLALMYFTLKQFTIYIAATVLSSEGMFYVSIRRGIRSQKSLLLAALKNVNLLSPASPRWLRASLRKVPVSFVFWHLCAQSRCVSIWTYTERSRGGSRVWMSHSFWCCTQAAFNNAVKHNDSPSEQRHDHRQ